MTVGQLKSLNGFVPFEANSLWNTDISSAPVDSNSANIINYIGSNVTLHPDFGSGTYAGHSIGIPYQIVAGTQVKVTVNPGAYADESDPRSYADSGYRAYRGLSEPSLPAIATSWCSRRTDAGYMSCSTLII